MLEAGAFITNQLNRVKVEEISNIPYQISTIKTTLNNDIIYKRYCQYLC